MITEHFDARLIAIGLEYEKFAAASDKLNELEPSDPGELKQEEERLFAEGHRLHREFSNCTAETLAGVYVQLHALGHILRWDGTSAAERARHSGSTTEALLWQIAAALTCLLDHFDVKAFIEGKPAVRRG